MSKNPIGDTSLKQTPDAENSDQPDTITIKRKDLEEIIASIRNCKNLTGYIGHCKEDISLIDFIQGLVNNTNAK